MPPRAQPRGGAAAAEDEDEQEELVTDEEQDELGEQSAVLSSYTTESGLSCLNVYRPGSQAKDPTANRYYGCLRLHMERYAKATKTPFAKAVTWVKRRQGGERGDVAMMTEEPVSFLEFLEEDGATTAGVYEMALRAMQWWIAKQAQVLGASVPKGFIANTPGTRERTKRVLEGKATLSKAKMEDLQGDEDDTLSRDDLIKMSTFCMSYVVAAGYFDHTPLLFVLALFTMSPFSKKDKLLLQHTRLQRLQKENNPPKQQQRKKQKALSSTPTAPVSKKAQEGGECQKNRGGGESWGRRPGFSLMFCHIYGPSQ